jgi:Xaa-Pro aminopeptidase
MKNLIESLRAQFSKYNIDGYIIPKNDEFFSEYSNKDRLKEVSNFSGSAGYAIILKNKNYLFVDSRYTIQAKIEGGKKFKILDYNKIFNCKIFKNLTIGLDPTLFTSNQIKKFFSNNKTKLIKENLIDNLVKLKNINSKSFYSLSKKIVGEDYKNKIRKIVEYLKKNDLDHIFITAPENVAWVLNIRGYDNPNSPIPNSNLLISKNNKKYIITEKIKLKKIIKEKKIGINEIINPKNIDLFLNNLKGKKISIDSKTCSLNYEQLLNKRLKIIKSDDPIYSLKSIKNKTEIKNMIKAHVSDGVALTKFIYWIKEINKKKITEVDAQNKLEKFRKKNKDYLFPSFNTIAGSGKNAAIVHYRANKGNTKVIKNKDIFLCDSGGQYNYGTTDVTRTICFSKQNENIKKIYTYVLKGHIAVVNTNLNKNNIGKEIDLNARKFLKKNGLDYGHGTGHGVGYFLNVHEGPQAISKFNSIKIKEGMILSNEPGFYKKDSFGIRIENLVYVKKEGKKLIFKNLTLAPIEKNLINYKILTKYEKDYLFKYHLEVYSKISSFLNKKEKKWLARFIQ